MSEVSLTSVPAEAPAAIAVPDTSTPEASASTPTPETSGASLTGGGEQLSEHTAVSWNDGLSDELRGNPSLQDIHSLEDLAKSMINAQQMIGGSIRKPGPDASKEDLQSYYDKVTEDPNLVNIPAEGEDMTALYRKLGMPETADGYTWEAPEGFEGMPQDNVGFKAMAHEIGLTNAQAGKIQKFLGGVANDIAGDKTETMKAGIYSLQKEWGASFEDRVSGAARIAQSFGDDFTKYLATSGAGNDPHMIKFMDQLAQNGAEPTMPAGARPSSALSPSEALLQASEIRNNTEHAYNNPMDPDHHAALAKMEKLYNYAYPPE